MSRYSTLLLAVLVVLAGLPLAAQNVVSAKAGIVHLAEGDVFLDGKQITPKPTEFPEIKAGVELRTEAGRAEVLLAPGQFLRLGEDSAMRMTKTALEDVRFSIEKGMANLEIVEYTTGQKLLPNGQEVHPFASTDDSLKSSRVTVAFNDLTVRVLKAGIFQFNAADGSLRAYSGELQALSGDKQWTVRGGTALNGSANGWLAAKFDVKETDPLFRWAKRRASYVAMANVAAARSATTSYGYGSGYSGLGSGRGWLYNPYLGMYTFIPMGGMMYSPFGWAYYTPRTVIYAYAPAYNGGGGSSASGRGGPMTPTYDSSLGYSVAGRGVSSSYSSGSSSTGAVSSSASAPAASAPAASGRGGGASTGARR
jgi:hypothetical protein